MDSGMDKDSQVLTVQYVMLLKMVWTINQILLDKGIFIVYTYTMNSNKLKLIGGLYYDGGNCKRLSNCRGVLLAIRKSIVQACFPKQVWILVLWVYVSMI